VAQEFSAADILAELVNRDGSRTTLPSFRRPTDREWQSDPEAAAERNAQVDEAEITWIQDNQVQVRWVCSADRSLVTIHIVGTSETATCRGGHRWLRTFGEHDGYRQLL
jgi:hypothetical protein